MPEFSDKLKTIKLNDIKDDLWDARTLQAIKAIDDPEIDSLAKSIKVHGLMHPIRVSLTDEKNNKYSIVSGRRRFRALLKLGYKQVECVIVEIKDKKLLEKETISENFHTKKLTTTETINAIVRSFELEGFTIKDILHYSKSLHNNDDVTTVPNKFRRVVEELGKAPNTIYQLIHIKANLSQDVYHFAKERLGLDTTKLTMLAHSKLVSHPKIQKQLAQKIQGLGTSKAKIIIAQAIRDLDTGAILKSGNSYIIQDSLREKVDFTIETETLPSEVYLDIIERTSDLLKLLTGHQITRGEYKYTDKHVEYSERHRIEIIQAVDERSILALEDDLQVLKNAVNSMLDIIDKEVISKKND